MPSFVFCRRLFCCAVASLILIGNGLQGSCQSPGPTRLRDEIDSHFEDDVPRPALASDAEFARRVAIDLTAMPLSVEELSQFLTDQEPDKRTKLIERLVETPQFERQLATFLDVTLMERRAYKDIKEAEWTGYLLESVRSNKPWNILAKEILSADGVDEKVRPAVRFALARDAEPNLLTRDIGRIFFGQDLQCAQCHNHPLVDDYLQSDYQGLLAFVAPGYVSTMSRPGPPQKNGKKAKPVSLKIYAEKDGNDIGFESVFVKNTKHRTGPRLIGEKSILEPSLIPSINPGARRPKHSRRKVLAEQSTDGTNRAFNENIANRLWGMMMGRGLVDPPDFHHRDNPPSNPELMELLGERFAEMKFDMRKFLVEIASSKVYQRAYDLPEMTNSISTAESQLKNFKHSLPQIEDRIKGLLKEYDSAEQQWSKAEAEHIPVAIEVEKLKKAFVATASQSAKVKSVFDAAKAKYEQQREVRDLVIASASSIDQAAKIGDQDLIGLNKRLATKLEKIQASTKSLIAKVTTAENNLKASQAKAKTASEALSQGYKKHDPLRLEYDRTESVARQIRTSLADQMSKRSALQSQISTLEKIIKLATVEQKLKATENATVKATEKAAVKTTEKTTVKAADGEIRSNLLSERGLLEDTVSIRLSNGHVVSALRPLTPEQYCWSVLKVTGYYQRFEKVEIGKLRKEQSLQADVKLNLEQRRIIEERTYAKLKGHLNNFVRYYSAGAGQPQGDFFATADQALFVVNGGTVNAYLNPASGNVTDKMMKAKQPSEVAQELYLGILSRKPSPEESLQVQSYLESQPEKIREAVVELAWGLLNSAEFRFNH